MTDLSPEVVGRLLELAARVEALEGADREVDALIAAAIRVGLPSGCDWAFKFPKWEGEKFGQVRIIGNVNGNGDYISGRFISPLFTASLDAAMSLVPEGWDASVGQKSDHGWAVVHNRELRFIGIGTRPNPNHRWFEVLAATPSLALVAAALKARAQAGGRASE